MLDAGAWFSPEFQGEAVPTLEELFETLPQSLLINFEVKQVASGTDVLPLA